MRVWSFCIAASQSEPDQARGFVRAETAGEAFARIGHQDANVYPCMPDVPLPDGPGPFLDGQTASVLG